MKHKFGSLSDNDLQRGKSADTEKLLKWSDKILSATGIEEIIKESSGT